MAMQSCTIDRPGGGLCPGSGCRCRLEFPWGLPCGHGCLCLKPEYHGGMTAPDEQSQQPPTDPPSDRRAEDGGPYYGSRQTDPKLPLEAEAARRPSFLIAAVLAILVVLGLFILGVMAY